ncbi:MAG: hypothetical protein WBM50_27185 [Acidimicrobiales bacterium]
MVTIETDRLTLRAPVEGDRARFVELFTNEAFMVFAGVLDAVAANARFDRMLAVAKTIPHGKQPVIDRVNGTVVGYTGVDTVELDGLVRLEWGWRFVPEARATSPKASSVTSTDGRSLTLSGEAQAASPFSQLRGPGFQGLSGPVRKLVVGPVGVQLIWGGSVRVRASPQGDPQGGDLVGLGRGLHRNPW